MTTTKPTPKATEQPKATEADAPKAKAAEPKPELSKGSELKPGYVVFFDAPVFGEDDQVHVGVVIAAKGGRVRVKPLGLAGDSADFPVDAVRLKA